jgi:hypothetical protein
MADTDVVAYRQRKSRVGMQHDAFLQIAVAADGDVLVVAAHADLKPQAGIVGDPHASDDSRRIGNINRRRNIGNVVA